MWKYEDLLPVTKNSAIVTLGEGWTPLVRMQQEEKKLPVKQLWIKREEQNPAGSFKARGFSAALSLLMEQGLNKPAVPSPHRARMYSVRGFHRTAVAVNHNQIAEAQHTLGALGISSSPEGAATRAGLLALCDNGWIRSKDTVVLFNTSHALKYNLSDSIATVPTIRSYHEFLSSYERT